MVTLLIMFYITKEVLYVTGYMGVISCMAGWVWWSGCVGAVKLYL